MTEFAHIYEKNYPIVYKYVLSLCQIAKNTYFTYLKKSKKTHPSSLSTTWMPHLPLIKLLSRADASYGINYVPLHQNVSQHLVSSHVRFYF